jgi:hypothetical protein
MRDILIKEDGTINTEAIDNYIKTNDINALYDNPDSAYHQQTLLSAAVSLREIKPGIKERLVTYLFEHGAEINNKKLINYGLVCIALANSDLSLANFLLKNGANTMDTYQGKNLLDTAIASKNEELMLWAIKNSTEIMINLFEGELDQYCKQFPSHQISLEFKRASILSKFEKLGKIKTNEIALVIAAKMRNKLRKNSIFVFDDSDIKKIGKEIKTLIENDTNEKIIKFQIIYFQGIHAICGEFKIDKTGEFPVLRYMHLDSLPEATEYYNVITLDFVKKISPLAKIEVCDSNVILQKGLGCTYMSIDHALMLSTPNDRDYAVNVMEYLNKNGVEETPARYIYKGFVKEINYKISSSLPARFLRNMQYISDEEKKEGAVSVLDSTFFNTSVKNTKVNKKEETAEASIQKNLQERPNKRNLDEMRIFNLRAENKMKQFQKNVKEFIRDKDILNPEFNKKVREYRYEGFKSFCNEKMMSKKEHTNENINRLSK